MRGRRKADQLIGLFIRNNYAINSVLQQRDEKEAPKAMVMMPTGLVVELTQEIALQSALVSIEHKLPMADSMILATARLQNAVLWTQDEHLKGLDGWSISSRTRTPLLPIPCSTGW